ncbi:S8 family peptidase [Lentzea sp. NPDC055074]
MRIKICIAAALFVAVLPTPAAHAEKDVVGTGDAVANSYIVVLKDGAKASPQALLSRYEGRIKRSYKAAISGFSVHEMSEKQARRLAADPSVAYVQRNLRMRSQDTQRGPVWGLDRIDQRALPLDNGYTYPAGAAQNVHAYVIDSGIRTTHSEFGGRASNGYDFIDDDPVADDCNGHGTHVASTLASRTFGVAKRAQVVGVKVLACNGYADADSVLAGIEWVTANGVRPAVVNMSLGAEGQNPAEEDAVRRSIAAGFTYVLAAGNSGRDACGFTPARTPEAITVGATSSNDARAVYPRWSSNFGPCVDIWAPGGDVQAASRNGDFASEVRGGTSMASPHVAGAAALYLGANPGATNQQVRDALVNGASTPNLRDLQAGSPNRLLRVGN